MLWANERSFSSFICNLRLAFFWDRKGLVWWSINRTIVSVSAKYHIKVQMQVKVLVLMSKRTCAGEHEEKRDADKSYHPWLVKQYSLTNFAWQTRKDARWLTWRSWVLESPTKPLFPLSRNAFPHSLRDNLYNGCVGHWYRDRDLLPEKSEEPCSVRIHWLSLSRHYTRVDSVSQLNTYTT